MGPSYPKYNYRLLVCKVESEVRAVYIFLIYPMTYMINGHLVRFKYIDINQLQLFNNIKMLTILHKN